MISDFKRFSLQRISEVIAAMGWGRGGRGGRGSGSKGRSDRGSSPANEANEERSHYFEATCLEGLGQKLIAISQDQPSELVVFIVCCVLLVLLVLLVLFVFCVFFSYL